MGIDELTALCNENAIPTGGNVTAAKMRSELIKALFPVDGDGGDDGDDGEDDDEEDSEEAPVSEAARRRRDLQRADPRDCQERCPAPKRNPRVFGQCVQK